jgi:hypothetical protein
VGVLHGAYQLPVGVAFGLDLGYAALFQKISGRSTTLTPVGFTANEGTASDSLVLSGVLAGASASFHRGAKLPFLVRLGGGALLGSVKDTRSGSFTAAASKGGGVFPVGPVSVSEDAKLFYVAPEVRLGYRFGGHFEVTLGVTSWVLVALGQPAWPDPAKEPNSAVVAGNQGLASFPQDTLAPKVLVVVTPGVGFRADF